MVYWQQMIKSLETECHDYKLHSLPLARIKKVMKADPEVKMISAEAPILFAKTCDIFITELTMRAWIHAEENKRRTLQLSDIAAALNKSDMFDFLIDIVPREDSGGQVKRTSGQGTNSGGSTTHAGGIPQLPQHPAQGQSVQVVQQVVQHMPMSQTVMSAPLSMSHRQGMITSDFGSSTSHPLQHEQDLYRGNSMSMFGPQTAIPAGIQYEGQPHQMYPIDPIYGFTALPPQQQVSRYFAVDCTSVPWISDWLPSYTRCLSAHLSFIQMIKCREITLDRISADRLKLIPE